MTAFGPRITAVARLVPTWVVYVAGLVPGLWLVWQVAFAGAYIDPLKALEHGSGLLALQFLLSSLAITPLLRLARINLLRFRKVLGLLGYGYLMLHFLTWLTLDLQLQWRAIGADLVKRPYIMVGFLGLLFLTPLAATSWDGAIRRMGVHGWGRLHRLVYPAVLLGAVHFVMQEKVWTPETLLYLGATAALVALRLAWIR